MIDNQIVKALECCAKLTHNSWGDNMKICEKECPYKANCYDEEKNINMIADVLDLINRQQAEIERLSKKNEELAEILSDTIRIRYAECKAETIKEFAERLKEICRKRQYVITEKTNFGVVNKQYLQVVDKSDIDNLVKEMTGTDFTKMFIEVEELEAIPNNEKEMVGDTE